MQRQSELFAKLLMHTLAEGVYVSTSYILNCPLDTGMDMGYGWFFGVIYWPSTSESRKRVSFVSSIDL